MKKLKELYQQSLQELCHTKTVVLCGLLAALAIVLSMVASIQLGPYKKLGDHDTLDEDRTAVEQGAVNQTGKHGIKGKSKEKRTIRL